MRGTPPLYDLRLDLMCRTGCAAVFSCDGELDDQANDDKEEVVMMNEGVDDSVADKL